MPVCDLPTSLYGVKSQKTIIFNFTDVRASNFIFKQIYFILKPEPKVQFWGFRCGFEVVLKTNIVSTGFKCEDGDEP
jgi:hypothetical protein